MHLQVNKIDYTCTSNIFNLAVRLDEGTHQYETKRFHLLRDEDTVEVNQLFTYVSDGFAFNSQTNKWSEKSCDVSLGGYQGGTWKRIGKARLDLSSCIDKGEMVQKFRLKNEGLGLNSVKLELRIKVSWPDTPEPKVGDS